VECLLRVNRRLVGQQADVLALRARLAAVDRRKFRVDPAARRTPASADGIPCEWLTMPESRPERVLLYLHGGGFALRTPNLHARYVARICRALGTRALIVDYRLAPEHPFPAAIEDCHAAYQWLLAQGIEPRHLVIAGDSAGGNLTLVTLQRILAAGEPLPACGFVLSPAVDLTMGSESYVANERADAIFTLASVLALRRQYVEPRLLTSPAVSPLFGELAGMPPLLLQAGSREMLRDDSVRFAAAARAAGIDVECEVWLGMQHVFPLLQFLPESARSIDTVARFVCGRTGWNAATADSAVPHLRAA
jgi:acetyl esterase/lipase